MFQNGFKHLFRGGCPWIWEMTRTFMHLSRAGTSSFPGFFAGCSFQDVGPQVFLSFLSFSFPLALPFLLLPSSFPLPFLFHFLFLSSSFPFPIGRWETNHPRRERERERELDYIHSSLLSKRCYQEFQSSFKVVSKRFESGFKVVSNTCLGGVVLGFGK